MKVIIAGGGIGGLTLAIALRRVGIACTVLERASELTHAGAGLMLQINAMKAMRRIGLDERIASIGVPVRSGLGFDRRGSKTSEVDLGAFERELGAPAIAMHRARLHSLLANVLGPGVIRYGARVAAFDESEGEVAAVLEDGAKRVSGDLLVGADGLHSAVRGQLLGDAEPRYAGYTSWRGVVARTGFAPANTVMEVWGRGLRFGMVAIGEGETYWFAVANAPRGQHDADPRAAVEARFASWPLGVADIVAATPPGNVFRTDIHDRDPIASFRRGRVALLGDAAHPTTPDLGQGGCLAVEDAVVLAKCLEESDSLEAALASYDERRVARAKAIVLASRRFGSLGKLQNGALVWLRDLALRLTPKSVVAKQTRATIAYEID